MSPLESAFGTCSSAPDIVRRPIARGAPLAIAALAGCDASSAPAATLDDEIEIDFRPALEVGEAGVNIRMNLGHDDHGGHGGHGNDN